MLGPTDRPTDRCTPQRRPLISTKECFSRFFHNIMMTTFRGQTNYFIVVTLFMMILVKLRNVASSAIADYDVFREIIKRYLSD